MELIIGAKHIVADITTGLDATGREHLVIIAKATWAIPQEGKPCRPIAAVPLACGDISLGEPGCSPPIYESDFVLRKPKCDVIFDACAHSPDGQPATQLGVGWRIGAHQKQVRVVGPRFWQKGLMGFSPSAPQPFTRMPLHFGLAFGGTRPGAERNGQMQFDTYEANPVGTGWIGSSNETLDGMPLPCLEAIDAPIERPDGRYIPMAFSPTARHWLPRRQYAGTYDEHWQKEVFPFLPEDFDDRYNQSAPEDQQIDHPKGGEPVILTNMMAGRPHVHFKLPRTNNLPIRVLMSDHTEQMPDAVVDTLFIEPDEGRLSYVWRASLPLKRGIQDVSTVAIGPICKKWWFAKMGGLDNCGCGSGQSTAKAPVDCPEEPET